MGQLRSPGQQRVKLACQPNLARHRARRKSTSSSLALLLAQQSLGLLRYSLMAPTRALEVVSEPLRDCRYSASIWWQHGLLGGCSHITTNGVTLVVLLAKK